MKFFLPLVLIFTYSNGDIERKVAPAIHNGKQLFNYQIQEILYQPSVKAPVHYHPCTVIGVVLSGSIAFQLRGEEMQYLNKGDFFVEPANAVVEHFDNASKDTKAQFMAIYLRKDKEDLIRIGGA